MAVAIDSRSCGAVKAARIAEHAVASIIEVLDLDSVPLRDAEDLWRAYDGIERLAANVKTLLAARVEDAGDWERAGARSAAAHLGNLSGTTVGAARRALATSKQLEVLSELAGALRSGRLSTAQANEIAGAAEADPSAEHRLIEFAATTNLHELRQECLRTKAAADPDPDARHDRLHTKRAIKAYTDAEGMRHVHLNGPPERLAPFEARLEPIIDEMFAAARADGLRESRAAYGFDAFTELFEDAAQPSDKSTRVQPRYLALLHVDLEALVRGATESEEKCEIIGVGPVPVRVARDLLGDAILKLVITKGVDVANVVHLGRGPTAAQRIALLWTSPKCSNRACSGTFVQNDHNRPWADEQRTVLGNIDPLCTHDHDLKTNHGWALVDGKRRRAFVAPDDPRHPKNKAPP